MGVREVLPDDLRDNALLTWMHTRLVLEFLLRLPLLTWRRLRGAPPFQYLGGPRLP